MIEVFLSFILTMHPENVRQNQTVFDAYMKYRNTEYYSNQYIEERFSKETLQYLNNTVFIFNSVHGKYITLRLTY